MSRINLALYIDSLLSFRYFGHGGMEQYISSRAIREMPKCASVMIWGCSSGLMKDQGDLDRIGTPYNYMVGGA